MNRRCFLATTAGAGSAAVAGCLDGIVGGEDAYSYPTQSFEGQTVPLAPLEDVYEWWEAEQAIFVDTRGQAQYDSNHVPGAYLLSVGEAIPDESADGWDTETTIVTYCDCPHTLAVQRAAGFLAAGYESVYALDDGYLEWRDAGYPTESNDPGASVSTHEITGAVATTYAGEYVHVSTATGDSFESVGIDADGSFVATIRFPDLTDDSVLVVETPSFTREGTLAELTADPVTAA